jgi:hypothetical protein
MPSMILTNSGHTAIAEAIYNSQLYLAWGGLSSFLGAPTGLSLSPSNGGNLVNGTTYYYQVTAFTLAGETNGSTTSSITITSTSKQITLNWAPVSGAIGYNIYGRTLADNFSLLATVTTNTYSDTGVGSVTIGVKPPSSDQTSATSWTTNPPTPLLTNNALYNEIGRRVVQLVQYVYPSSTGPYTTPSGTWAISTVPTSYVYAYVGFALTDAPTATIYQFGLFLNTVPAPGYISAPYLTPAQITSPGSLLALENITPIYRNTSSREIHEVVMSF